jgi:hypothetical protein
VEVWDRWDRVDVGASKRMGVDERERVGVCGLVGESGIVSKWVDRCGRVYEK